MQKITIGTSDGRISAFVPSPAYVDACWREVFGSFQKLGTKAMGTIEVVTTEPVDQNTVRVKVVVSIRDQRRECLFSGNPNVIGEISSEVIKTFWNLISDIKEFSSAKLQTLAGLQDFSKPLCSKCGAQMFRFKLGERPVDSFSCPGCCNTTRLESDWVLEKVPAAKTCQACGHDMELIQGKVLKCPNCFESIPGVPGT